MQKLREAIDLIVVPAIRELQKLSDKISMPICLCWEMDLTRFYSRRHSDKAISFISLRNDTDRADASAGGLEMQLAKERAPQSDLLNQNGVGSVIASKRTDLTAKI
jgi:hypothetical protein